MDGSSHDYTCPLGSSAGMASRHQAPSCCKHYLKARASLALPRLVISMALPWMHRCQKTSTLLEDQEFFSWFLEPNPPRTKLLPCGFVSPTIIVLLLLVSSPYSPQHLDHFQIYFQTNLFAVNHRRPVKSTARCQTCSTSTQETGGPAVGNLLVFVGSSKSRKIGDLVYVAIKIWGNYPLVNIQKAIENCHLWWIYP